jgi:hypothetical protein
MKIKSQGEHTFICHRKWNCTILLNGRYSLSNRIFFLSLFVSKCFWFNWKYYRPPLYIYIYIYITKNAITLDWLHDYLIAKIRLCCVKNFNIAWNILWCLFPNCYSSIEIVNNGKNFQLRSFTALWKKWWSIKFLLA